MPAAAYGDVLRRQQPGIVAECFNLVNEMMRTDASLHVNQARRHVGKPCLHLSTQPLLTQHDGTTRIKTNEVKRGLADIDTDDSNCSVEYLKLGVFIVFGAPSELRLLVGQEDGRTIPLPDVPSGLNQLNYWALCHLA